MERALLDVEHNNELKKIQNDELKLKNLQQEHQLRIDTFTKHSTKVRVIIKHSNSFFFFKLNLIVCFNFYLLLIV